MYVPWCLVQSHANKRGRDSLEIAARVLDMVQAWGEAFLPYRVRPMLSVHCMLVGCNADLTVCYLQNEYPLFVETYHNMRKKGVVFPKQYDETRAPVLTPPAHESPATAPFATGSIGRRIDTSSVSSSSSGMGGLSPQELFSLASTVSEMFEDMLYEAQKTDSGIEMRGVIDELATQARELAHRMEALIQLAVNEDSDVSCLLLIPRSVRDRSWVLNAVDVRCQDIGKYLTVNDSLNQALETFVKLKTRSQADNQEHEDDPKAAPAKEQKTVQLIDFFDDSSSIPTDNQHEDNEDPFAEFVRVRAGSLAKSSDRGSIVEEVPRKSASASEKQAVQSNQDEEDDPFASFVEQRVHKVIEHNEPAAETKPTTKEMDLIDFGFDGKCGHRWRTGA